MKILDDLQESKNHFSNVRLSKEVPPDSLHQSLEAGNFNNLDLRVGLPAQKTPMNVGKDLKNAIRNYDSDENDSVVQFRNGSNSPDLAGARRGRSPVQPTQKGEIKFQTVNAPARRSLADIKGHLQQPAYFDDGQKHELYNIFVNKKAKHEEYFEGKPTEYDKTIGVKTYNALRKNANSVDDYHILSNLTVEQEK